MNFCSTHFKPEPLLENLIESYWLGNFNLNRSSEFSQHVVPNGCIELIIHLSEHHCALTKDGGVYRKSPPFTLLGVYDKPYIVKFSDFVEGFGIRFYPDGFKNIFGVPPGLFLSRYEDGIDVIGSKLREFCLKIRQAADTDEKLNRANSFLIVQSEKNQTTQDRTHMAMKLIRDKHGRIAFKEIRENIPISFRQLQRDFKDSYGLNITDYIRLTRLNAINRYLLSRNINLTQLAYNLDFTDQSHFIREFKHFTGLAPRKFINEMGDFIINPV